MTNDIVGADPAASTARKRAHDRWPRMLRTKHGVIGAVMAAAVLAVAVIGPSVASHPIDEPLGAPGSAPGDWALGTDYLGRDVLSRLLHGGFSVVWVALLSAALIYLSGTAVGLIAGISRSWLDPLLMRTVDVFIVFPPLVLLLVLIAGAGNKTWVLVLGVVLVLAPGVARIVRSATLEISTKNYVEAAVLRGERTSAVLVREILPNILPAIVADFGVRFLGAVFIIANLDFLGFGAQPPTANWALMIAENRVIIGTNPWSVFAPGLLLAMLTIAVNLMGDAFVGTRSKSGAE
ncbi:ABC transporter permease [uncultured Jatrophihabitans sp.]|uniref:ABC transporter permease n=1 Tax=uncultured Jatrophihabitans sp. TaxID=1610747 RepID=UPI0035CAE4ED